MLQSLQMSDDDVAHCRTRQPNRTRSQHPCRMLFPDDRRDALPDVPQIPHQIVVEAETFWEQYLFSLNNQGWNRRAIEELEGR